MDTLGERLKSIRESQGLGQKDIENITGISFKTISNYENNRSEPDVERLSLLCKAYNVSADYFINYDFEVLRKNNFFLHLHEQEHIKKYRKLDKYGKEMIDIILQKEGIRCDESNKEVDNPNDHLIPIAAHNDDTSEEQVRLMREDLDEL